MRTAQTFYHSGHVWEESLFWGPAGKGTSIASSVPLSAPGGDTLVEWAHQSGFRLREVASVAALEGTHVFARMRGAGQRILPKPRKDAPGVQLPGGAWDIGEFIPHAFNYDLTCTNYPPDWFRSQTSGPGFAPTRTRCGASKFRQSREPATGRAGGAPYPRSLHLGESGDGIHNERVRSTFIDNANWSPDAVETSGQYTDLKMRLTRAS